MITDVDNTETKGVFQVLIILKPLFTDGYEQASSQKAGRKWHFWQQLLKTKEQSLTSWIVFRHLATLRLKGNLKDSQISPDIFTERNLVYLSNMIIRFPLNSTVSSNVNFPSTHLRGLPR